VPQIVGVCPTPAASLVYRADHLDAVEACALLARLEEAGRAFAANEVASAG